MFASALHSLLTRLQSTNHLSLFRRSSQSADAAGVRSLAARLVTDGLIADPSRGSWKLSEHDPVVVFDWSLGVVHQGLNGSGLEALSNGGQARLMDNPLGKLIVRPIEYLLFTKMSSRHVVHKHYINK